MSSYQRLTMRASTRGASCSWSSSYLSLHGLCFWSICRSLWRWLEEWKRPASVTFYSSQPTNCKQWLVSLSISGLERNSCRWYQATQSMQSMYGSERAYIQGALWWGAIIVHWNHISGVDDHATRHSGCRCSKIWQLAFPSWQFKPE